MRLAKSASTDAPAKKARSGVTVSDLIATGTLRAPLELRRTFKGVEVRARIDADGSVVVDGQRTQSLSTAGGIAIARVRKVDPKSDSVATDGWAFWRFTDSDGSEKPIDALRVRYLDRRGSCRQRERGVSIGQSARTVRLASSRADRTTSLHRGNSDSRDLKSGAEKSDFALVQASMSPSFV
ncbi:MAG: hypothetical protein IPH13_08910 [Planctomycetes bacterium]|nr:hypothetical protein [Planctomycetota bacterium]MCC7172276.1 hypothetical protein [Planctomycetota bacterium]